MVVVVVVSSCRVSTLTDSDVMGEKNQNGQNDHRQPGDRRGAIDQVHIAAAALSLIETTKCHS